MGQVYQLPRAQQSLMFDRSADALLAWEASTPDTIDFKRTYTQIAGGDVKAGLLLSQIFFRFKPSLQGRASSWLVQHDGRRWFPRPRKAWKIECTLSPKAFDRASNVLVTRGLITKGCFRYHGSPTVHVSLNVEALADQVEALGLTRRENGISPISPKGKLEFPQKGKSLRKTFLKIQNPEILSPTPLLPQSVVTSTRENSGALRTKDEKTETPACTSSRTADPVEALPVALADDHQAALATSTLLPMTEAAYAALPDDLKARLEAETRAQLVQQGQKNDFLPTSYIREATRRRLTPPAGGELPVAPDPSGDDIPLSPPLPACEPPTDFLLTCAGEDERDGDVPAKAALPPPTATKILPADLQDTARLMDLCSQLVQRGVIGSSQADRFTAVALAEHVLERVQLRDCDNPGGLYLALLRKSDAERDRFISDRNEDAACQRLRVYDYGSPPPPPVAPPPPDLSQDAVMLRELQRVAERQDFTVSEIRAELARAFPEIPSERWMAAAGELATVQHASALARLREVDTGGAWQRMACAECGEDHQTCACRDARGMT